MKAAKLSLYLLTGLISMAIYSTVSQSHTRVTHTEVEFEPASYELLARFHGHVGPYVVLGNMIGEHAVTRYKFPQYFGITVEAECPAEPPFSCLLDGLQIGTGATMGKRNIVIRPADEIRVTIKNDKTGETAVYRLKEATKSMLKQWEADAIEVEERGRITYKMSPEDLLEIEYCSNG